MRHVLLRFLLVALIISGLVLVVVGVMKPGDRPVTWLRTPAAPTSSPTQVAPSTSKSPTPEKRSAKPASLPAVCRSQTPRPFVPTSIELRSVVTAGVLSLGLSSEGIPAPPPFDKNMEFSWYDLGPGPNAPTGTMVFQAHTFSKERALGNIMLEKFRYGNVIVIRGAKGANRCYRVDQQPWNTRDVNRYQKRVYDFGGSSRATFTVCSDYKDGEWRTRTVWFASPLPVK